MLRDIFPEHFDSYTIFYYKNSYKKFLKNFPIAVIFLITYIYSYLQLKNLFHNLNSGSDTVRTGTKNFSGSDSF